MAELADAIDLGSIVIRRAGSSPVIRSRGVGISGTFLHIEKGVRQNGNEK